MVQVEQVNQNDWDLPSSCRLRVVVHGPLQVWKRDPSGAWKQVDKEAWGKGRPARSVFKRLLVAPGRRLSRGAIQDDLWPDAENFESTEKSVYNAINQIRHVTGKELVKTFDTSYQLADQALIWVDWDSCEALLKEAENQGSTSAEALPLLERALTYLERGQLLEGEDGTWVYGFRQHSEEMLKHCRCWLAQNYLQQNKPWQAHEQVQKVLTEFPDDEDVVRYGEEMRRRLKYHTFYVPAAMQVIAASSLSSVAETLGPANAQERPAMDQLRRSLVGMAGSLTAMLFFNGSQFEEILKEVLTSAHVNQEILDHFERLTTLCWQLKNAGQMPLVTELLAAYLPRLTAFAHQPTSYQLRAAFLASLGYTLGVYTARSKSTAKLFYSQNAVLYSQISGDLSAQVMALRSYATTQFTQNPSIALTTYQQALPLLKEIKAISPALQSRMYLGLASATARVYGKERQTEALAYLDLARESYPAHPEEDALIVYVSEACEKPAFHLYEALTYSDLQQTQNTWDALMQVDGLHPKMAVFEGTRIELLNLQAKTAALSGQLEQSCTSLSASIRASAENGMTHWKQEAFEVYTLLCSIWPHEQQVQELAQLFTA